MIQLKTKNYSGKLEVKNNELWAYVVMASEIVTGTNFSLNTKFNDIFRWLNAAAENHTQQKLELTF